MAGPPRAADGERRPVALLLVYTWDMVAAIIAIFEALAAFAGGVVVGPRQIEVPLPLQLLGALSAASFAALLIILASLLTRRMRWVQRLQIATLALAVAFAIVSVVAGWFEGSVGTVEVLTATLVMLVDILAIVVMTERRVSAWYSDVARVPLYVSILLGFWLASSAALIAVDTLR